MTVWKELARQIDPSGKSTSDLRKSCQAKNSIENISLYQKYKSGYMIASRPDQRGVAIVTNAGRGAVDAEVPLTNGMEAYGKDVWS